MMDKLALLQGVTTPVQDMIRAIQQHGWELGKVQYDSKLGQFVAEATSPIGDRPISKFGPDESTAVANLMNAVVRRHHMRTTAMWKVGMWPVTFHDKLHEIADAYRQAPIYDPKAAAAWKALGDDSMHRLHVLGEQLHIEPTNEPQPYATADEMRKDVHEKRHYYLTGYNSQHPVWTPDQVGAFRAVHDILGHGVAGGQYDWPGRNLAAAAHFPLLEPLAQQALFTEAVARPAYLHTYGQGPVKVAVFPDYIDGPIEDHNPSGHRGLHPSQTVAPVALHGVTSNSNNSFDVNYGWDSGVDPLPHNAYMHHGDPVGAKATMDNAALIDTGWSNFKTGDGSDDRERMKLAIVNAFRAVLLSPRKDLRWNAIHYQHIMDIPGGVDDPKVYWDKLEGHRRRWNEAQGIHPDAHMPYFEFVKPFQAMIHAQHPEKGWGYAKEKAERTLFNWWTQEQEKIAKEDASKPSEKQRLADEVERRANESLARRLKIFLKPKDENVDFEDAQTSLFASVQDVREHLADVYPRPDRRHILEWESGTPGKGILFRDGSVHTWSTHAGDDEQYGYLDADDGAPSHATWLARQGLTNVRNSDKKPEQHFAIAPNGNVSASDWCLPHLQEADPRLTVGPRGRDFYQLFSKEAAGGQYNLLTGEEGLKYGAFMGTHLKAIAKVSQHADEILDAALQDVREHDATGHHFRHAVLSLGVSGVGPKVCSFAWLLLQPLTSQIATIDTHMMDVLGHHYEKEMNNRDYFKFERELAAGRDAAGYSHVPLGPFQWGMWDHKRTGPGTHQDHSAMRVLDPTPHSQVDWVGKAVNLKGESWHNQAPDWWQNTQPAREQIAQEWDNTYAKEFPQSSIPYQDMGLQMAAAQSDSWGYINDDKLKEIQGQMKVHQGTTPGTLNLPHKPVMYDTFSKQVFVGQPGATHQDLRTEFGGGFAQSEFGGPHADLQYGVISPRNEIAWYGNFPGEDSWGYDSYAHAHAIDQALGTKYLNPENTPNACPKCGGSGADYDASDGYYHDAQGMCDDCGGTGRIRGNDDENWGSIFAAAMDWEDAFVGPPEERASRPYMRFWKGITVNGQDHKWDASHGTHIDYMLTHGIDPSQVQRFWAENYDGERTDLSGYRPDYQRYWNDSLDEKTGGYDEGFEYWWKQETPIGSSLDSKARKLAEYAKADKKTSHFLEEFLDDHKDETRLSDEAFKRFKNKLFKKFERISKIAARSTLTPIMTHPHTGEEHVGMPGQTLMEHARLMTGMNTQDVWRLLADEHVKKTASAGPVPANNFGTNFEHSAP